MSCYVMQMFTGSKDLKNPAAIGSSKLVHTYGSPIIPPLKPDFVLVADRHAISSFGVLIPIEIEIQQGRVSEDITNDHIGQMVLYLERLMQLHGVQRPFALGIVTNLSVFVVVMANRTKNEIDYSRTQSYKLESDGHAITALLRCLPEELGWPFDFLPTDEVTVGESIGRSVWACNTPTEPESVLK